MIPEIATLPAAAPTIEYVDDGLVPVFSRADQLVARTAEVCSVIVEEFQRHGLVANLGWRYYCTAQTG